MSTRGLEPNAQELLLTARYAGALGKHFLSLSIDHTPNVRITVITSLDTISGLSDSVLHTFLPVPIIPAACCGPFTASDAMPLAVLELTAVNTNVPLLRRCKVHYPCAVWFAEDPLPSKRPTTRPVHLPLAMRFAISELPYINASVRKLRLFLKIDQRPALLVHKSLMPILLWHSQWQSWRAGVAHQSKCGGWCCRGLRACQQCQRVAVSIRRVRQRQSESFLLHERTDLVDLVRLLPPPPDANDQGHACQTH
mmetsp:Transcript_21512/g.37910  ORF Transcript_21512/g.37910 Transcript_21512/m.37910 type:complete len:253 (+) Transcript_21512:196-954(+)